MADSLRARVGRVIASSMHALIDRIEDQAPEAAMEQSVREADEVIDDVRHELGLVSANRHLAQQQHARLNRQHEELADQIELALSQAREDLARAAVARQLDIEAQLPVLENTLADHSGKEAELQSYVAALLAKKREMEEALSQFRKSRATTPAAATAHGQPPATAEHRMGSITGAFDRIYERQTGLGGTARSNSLDQTAKLKALEELMRDNKVAERMAQLKAAKA